MQNEIINQDKTGKNNTQISILGERNIDGYINIFFKNSSLTINNKSREATFKINYEMQDSVLSNYTMNGSIIDLGDDNAHQETAGTGSRPHPCRPET